MSPTPYEGQGKAWAAGRRRPGSKKARVETWLNEHPGLWRAADIGAALDETTHSIACVCYGLVSEKRIIRATIPEADRPAYPYRNGARWTGYRAPTDLDGETVAAN